MRLLDVCLVLHFAAEQAMAQATFDIGAMGDPQVLLQLLLMTTCVLAIATPKAARRFVFLHMLHIAGERY